MEKDMDEILGLLEGPITVILVILTTVAAVELYKKWTVRKADAWWYSASVITAAWFMGIGWAALRMFANNEEITWRTWAALAFHGGIIGMVASGGYKWFQKVREFVGISRIKRYSDFCCTCH